MMERIFVGVLYLSGWLTFSTCLLRQYHFVPDSKNWTEAQSYCRETYTDLATIGNTKEMNQLTDMLLSIYGTIPDVWIGLHSAMDWRWSDGYTGSGAEYRNWDFNVSEPNFYSSYQSCVDIGSSGGWWYDSCSKQNLPICYKGTQLNPQFVCGNENMDWFSAQRYCRQNFTDLATVRNATENLVIKECVSSGGWGWIGLSGDLIFYWSDQSSFSFSFWDSSYSLIDRRVVCGVRGGSSGRWRFLPCETNLPFVCYSVPLPAPVNRQVMKLRMKLDDVSVDPNDPAVKAGILTQLRERLKENGVSGVTLKWREQPDGKIFHQEKGST